jgi:hypothetical protein
MGPVSNLIVVHLPNVMTWGFDEPEARPAKRKAIAQI